MQFRMITIFAVFLTLTSGLFAERMVSVSEKASGENVKSIDAEIIIGAGRFDITGARLASGTFAEAEGRYDERRYKHKFEFDQSGSSGDLFLSSELRGKISSQIGSEENQWECSFAEGVDWRLDVNAGAAVCNFDFSGMTISEFALDVGAAEFDLDFATPNQTRLTRFKINAGACDLKIDNIGNTKFEQLDFEGGLGSFTLDFSGEFDYEAEARIEVGMGSVKIILPTDIGVRLEADEHWFNSIDFSKRKLKKVGSRDDVYETVDFDNAKGQLTIILDIGMGSADIDFR